MDVIVTGPGLAAQAVALLEGTGARLSYTAHFPTAEATAALAAQVQPVAILARLGPVTAAVMDAAPGLRIVARHGVGVDDVDLAAAAARGVLVTRAPGSNTVAVAEHTMALLLALVKDLPGLSVGMARGDWRRPDTQVRDLAGMRLGLVGFGAIGQAVARLALGFGIQVAAWRRTAAMPGVREAASLAALLAESDALSLHAPLTADTRSMIGAAELALLPRGAFVVNTARGGLVDEAALLAALASGQVAGAGLDVFADEPPAASSPLRAHPRVIATPHIAGVTPSSQTAMGVMAAECIAAVLRGEPVAPERIVRA